MELKSSGYLFFLIQTFIIIALISQTRLKGHWNWNGSSMASISVAFHLILHQMEQISWETRPSSFYSRSTRRLMVKTKFA